MGKSNEATNLQLIGCFNWKFFNISPSFADTRRCFGQCFRSVNLLCVPVKESPCLKKIPSWNSSHVKRDFHSLKIFREQNIFRKEQKKNEMFSTSFFFDGKQISLAEYYFPGKCLVSGNPA